MKILIIAPDKSDPTAFYRASGIVHDLERQTGYQMTVIGWSDISITWQLLAGFDLLFLQRPFNEAAVGLCDYAKDMGRPVWVDYDDNLFVLNPENKAFNTYNSPAVQENVKKCLEKADVVTVPNEYLKQCYLQYNKNIKVIPNAFNDDIFKYKVPKKREKSVLWRGPESHIYDLMTYGREINTLTEDFPDHEFYFMGYYPWFLLKTNNKSYLPGHDIIMYFKRLYDIAPKVVHIPLHDNTFNRCRSNIGYIEGTYSGAVCVVPGWWNAPGALQYDTPKDYYDAIKSILKGEVDASALNKNAWEYILEVLPLSKVNKKRVELIESLI
jgi:hypothetical protein